MSCINNAFVRLVATYVPQGLGTNKIVFGEAPVTPDDVLQ
jgi:hypothetical protein